MHQEHRGMQYRRVRATNRGARCTEEREQAWPDAARLTAQHGLDFVLVKGGQRVQREDGAEALAEGGDLLGKGCGIVVDWLSSDRGVQWLSCDRGVEISHKPGGSALCTTNGS